MFTRQSRAQKFQNKTSIKYQTQKNYHTFYCIQIQIFYGNGKITVSVINGVILTIPFKPMVSIQQIVIL